MSDYVNVATAVRTIFENCCQKNGYTELFCYHAQWWAFPPNGVIPVRVYRAIKQGRVKSQSVRVEQKMVTLLPDGRLKISALSKG